MDQKTLFFSSPIHFQDRKEKKVENEQKPKDETYPEPSRETIKVHQQKRPSNQSEHSIQGVGVR